MSSSDTTTLAVRQIYWVNGRFEASDARAKAWGAGIACWAVATMAPSVIVYAPSSARATADSALDAVLRAHLKAIESATAEGA